MNKLHTLRLHLLRRDGIADATRGASARLAGDALPTSKAEVSFDGAMRSSWKELPNQR